MQNSSHIVFAYRGGGTWTLTVMMSFQSMCVCVFTVCLCLLICVHSVTAVKTCLEVLYLNLSSLLVAPYLTLYLWPCVLKASRGGRKKRNCYDRFTTITLYPLRSYNVNLLSAPLP